jgi:hypothetical protein
MKKTFFNHDSNARNDLKLIKLRKCGGWEYYGIYFAILELLFSEENKLCIEDYETLAFGLQCDTEKLKQVIEDFDLFVIEGNCFYSKRLFEHIEEINLKSKKAKESINKRWSNTNVIRSNKDSNTSISISKAKVNKSIEDRIEAFKNAIHSIKDISDEDKNDFFLYWTERNKSGSKFRAELQKTFDINLRLKRWASNGFNKNTKTKYLDYYDEYAYKKLDETSRKEYTDHLISLGFETVYSPTAGTTWRKKHKV